MIQEIQFASEPPVEYKGFATLGYSRGFGPPRSVQPHLEPIPRVSQRPFPLRWDREFDPLPSSEESRTIYPAARRDSAFCPPKCRHLAVKIPFDRACSRGTRICWDAIVQKPGDCDAGTRPIHHLDRY